MQKMPFLLMGVAAILIIVGHFGLLYALRRASENTNTASTADTSTGRNKSDNSQSDKKLNADNPVDSR